MVLQDRVFDGKDSVISRLVENRRYGLSNGSLGKSIDFDFYPIGTFSLNELESFACGLVQHRASSFVKGKIPPAL